MTVPEMSSADEISPREQNVRQTLPEIVRARARANGERYSFDTFFYDLEE